jgi:hypothetical protein
MPPSAFVNTYQQYKKLTDNIARWLVETAEQCGYTYDAQTTPKPSKEDAPHRPAKKPDCGETSAPTSDTPLHRIRLAQFTELAQVIAASKKAVVTPRVIRLFQTTISLRRQYSRLFGTQKGHLKTSSTSERNASHFYFVEILEQVLEILKPQSLGPEKKVDEEAKQSVAENRFNNLQPVEHDEPDYLNDSHAPIHNGVTVMDSSSPRHVVYETESDNEEEIYFAIYCFFEDLREIRTYVRRIWTEYKLGIRLLENVAIITNTAIDFVRRAHEELRVSVPRISHSIMLSSYFFMFSCLMRGVDPLHREEAGDWYNYEMEDVADLVYLPNQVILSSFCDVLSPGYMPQFKPGHFGIYNPEASRSGMTLRQKLAENKILVTEILAEFCLLGHCKAVLAGQDELTRGLMEMYNTKNVTTWLCFATQIYLDINHILRRQIRTGLEDMTVAGKIAKSSLQATLKFTAPSTLKGWPKSNDKILLDSITFIDVWILDDAVEKIRRQLLGSQVQGKNEPYFLLARHPLLCGLLKFSITLMLHKAGTAVAETWGSILYVAHLYNTLRQNSELSIPWPDIETFVSIYSPEVLFVGGLPSTLEDCLKRYCLMMGVAPQTFAKDRLTRNKGGNNPKLLLSPKGPRAWAESSPIVSIFKERYVTLTGSVDWSLHKIEALLNKAANKNAVPNRSKKANQLSTLELLHALQDALSVEAPALTYDYLGMHFECMDLLRSLRTQLQDRLVVYFGPEAIKNEDQLCFIVGLILEVAYSSQKSAASIRELEGYVSYSKMLEQASETVEKVIKERGSRYAKQGKS